MYLEADTQATHYIKNSGDSRSKNNKEEYQSTKLPERDEFKKSTLLWKGRAVKLFFFSLISFAYSIGATIYIIFLISYCRSSSVNENDKLLMPGLLQKLEKLSRFDPSKDCQVATSTTNELIEYKEKLKKCLQKNNQNCEDGWDYLDSTDSCYRAYYVDGNIPQVDARRSCRANHASLVSIKNAQENGFVYDVALKNPKILRVWLGMEYDAEQKKRIWLDGTSMEYTSWGFPEAPKDPERTVTVVSSRSLDCALDISSWWQYIFFV